MFQVTPLTVRSRSDPLRWTPNLEHATVNSVVPGHFEEYEMLVWSSDCCKWWDHALFKLWMCGFQGISHIAWIVIGNKYWNQKYSVFTFINSHIHYNIYLLPKLLHIKMNHNKARANILNSLWAVSNGVFQHHLKIMLMLKQNVSFTTKSNRLISLAMKWDDLQMWQDPRNCRCEWSLAHFQLPHPLDQNARQKLDRHDKKYVCFFLLWWRVR
jgi:hypothetical protein